jgi:hypothetical protein
MGLGVRSRSFTNSSRPHSHNASTERTSQHHVCDHFEPIHTSNSSRRLRIVSLSVQLFALRPACERSQ